MVEGERFTLIDKSYDIGANRFGLFFCNSDRFNRAVNSIIVCMVQKQQQIRRYKRKNKMDGV